jgi:hypothetical protein
LSQFAVPVTVSVFGEVTVSTPEVIFRIPDCTEEFKETP